jgi:hypothetical protein
MPNGEKWSVNPVWQIGGVSTAEDVSADQCMTMATAIDALTISSGLTNLIPSSCYFSGTRVEARRWDGTLSSQAEHARAAPVAGTGTSPHPFQTSLVLSLRTGTPGASGRGRLYFPATGAAINVLTLRPSSALVSSALLGAKTLLTSITTALNVTLVNDAVLSVWSRNGASTAPVNSIQMGDVFDVQRRRRDALLEAYTTSTYPT